MEPTPTKDIALAVLGGSAALASILLVFIGFMVAKVEGLPSSTSAPKKRELMIIAKLGLVPIIGQVFVMVCSYAWLFWPESTCLYRCWAIGFVVGLGLFLLYSIYATLRL